MATSRITHSISLDEATSRQLKEYGEREQRTISWIITKALQLWFGAEESRKARLARAEELLVQSEQTG